MKGAKEENENITQKEKYNMEMSRFENVKSIAVHKSTIC